MGPRLRYAVLAAALCAVLPASAHAEPGAEVVGGPQLGSTGIVVNRTATTPPLPAVSAAGWVVADAGTGEVLAARNAHGRFLPASTLKTLTAVALLPRLNLHAKYTAKPVDVNIEGSKVGLVAGTAYTVHSLVESMLIVSGNDSAAALASVVGGMPAAAQLMNAEARRLQANDTLARNTSGLDAPGQVTSAYDLALVNRAGLAMPSFAKYVRTLRSSMPAPGGRRFETYNHNKLLTRYAGNVGIKTGYTVAARHTYVGAATRDGHTILVTLLKAESKYPDAVALMDWGFAATGKVVPVGRLVDPLPDPADDDTARADRSRTNAAAPGTAPAAAPPPARLRSGRPVLPVAGGVVLAGGALALRRRAVRRRRYGASSSLRLNLPVR